ncbi:MAG: hypothetical protein AAGA76_05440 [Pseudomonadota bacterium]
MADYYSILNKTISGLAKNTPEVRQAVYAKARIAIEDQLRRMTPPPLEEAIAEQLKLLEEAIIVIDSEFASEQLDPSFAEPTIPDEPPTVSEVSPAPESVAPPPTPVADVSQPQSSPQVEESAAAPVQSPVSNDQPQTYDDHVETGKKSGNAGKILVYLLIVALLGGTGYGVWANRSSLEPVIASLFGSSDQPETTSDTDEASEQGVREVRIAEDNEEKEPVRLGADGQDEAPEPSQIEQAQTGSEETPLVLEQQGEEPAPVETQPEVEPVVEGQTAEDTTQNQPEIASANTLGEVAYLYEEGGAGAGATRASATVNWSIARVKPSEDLPPEPVIVGKMDVPEKGLAIELNIKRNVDPALSASHIIELTFEVPNGFAGGSIDNIARFVMKPTEEARGEPLVAVPVKVSDGYFLIALDNLDQAIEVNRQLLLRSSWIDVPVSYSTGKRALLTLEKGGSGEQVFKEAFEYWNNR